VFNNPLSFTDPTGYQTSNSVDLAPKGMDTAPQLPECMPGDPGCNVDFPEGGSAFDQATLDRFNDFMQRASQAVIIMGPYLLKPEDRLNYEIIALFGHDDLGASIDKNSGEALGELSKELDASGLGGLASIASTTAVAVAMKGKKGSNERSVEGALDTAKKDKTIYRMGTDKESASRLGRKSQEAESQIGQHGVSASTTKPQVPCSSTSCSSLEDAGFRVVSTPTRNDPGHVTVELPNPVTPDVAKLFNDVFGR
jgi:hypothetical protein